MAGLDEAEQDDAGESRERAESRPPGPAAPPDRFADDPPADAAGPAHPTHRTHATSPGDTHGDGRRALRLRRLATVVAAVALLGLTVVVLRPTPPPVPLLGQVGATAGLSATGPPPGALRLAWQADLPPGAVTDGVRGRHVVAADGRVRIGGVVVDVAGRGIARRAAADPGAARDRVEHVGGTLVVVDTLTGEVTARTPVRAPAGAQLVARARSGDVTLLTDAGRSLLVRDDGTVLAELDGTIARSDRAVDDAAAFPVSVDTNQVQLVAAATGEVVVDLTAPPGDLLAVDVLGDLALVSRASGRLPGPETGVPWQVDLVDAGTGQRQRQLVIQSAEPPRLLGSLDDGTTVLASRSGREVAVRGVFPDGRFDFIAQVTTGAPAVVDGVEATTSALLATVGTSSGVVVGLDARRGLLGLAPGGNALWQVEAADAAVLGAGDGYVAALPGGHGGDVAVHDATDGSVVARITPAEAGLRTVNRPLAVLDGHVGLGRARRLPDRLGSISWLELRTGVTTPTQELFAPHAPPPRDTGGEPEVSGSWTVHGVIAAGDPVVTRRSSRSSLQVLEPGARFVTVELPGRSDDGVAGYVAEPVGASTTRLAVLTRDFEEPSAVATHVLDRTTGAIATVPGVHGLVLVEDLLVGVEVDRLVAEPTRAPTLVGADATDGERLWTLEAAPDDLLWSRPLGIASSRIDRELLVVAAPLAVQAISLREGESEWSHASDVELAPDHVVLTGRHVVVAATDGEVLALDRDDGTVAWRTRLGVPVEAMTGAGEHVLVGTAHGLVIHLDGEGEEVQRIAVGTDPVLAVAALGETVVAVVGDAVVGLRADGTGIPREDEVEVP